MLMHVKTRTDYTSAVKPTPDIVTTVQWMTHLTSWEGLEKFPVCESFL